MKIAGVNNEFAPFLIIDRDNEKDLLMFHLHLSIQSFCLRLSYP